MERRTSQNRTKITARLARVQDKLTKLRARVKRSTALFWERREARLAWWQNAFRGPHVAEWAIFSQAKTLLAAFISLLGLPHSKPHRSYDPRLQDIRRRNHSSSRNLNYENLEGRVLLAGDTTAPILSANSPLMLDEASTAIITTTLLDATDDQTAADSLVFEVTSSTANGQLELTTNSGIEASSFTRAQLGASQVKYIHDGSNTVSDSFVFGVRDAAGNTLSEQQFSISITPAVTRGDLVDFNSTQPSQFTAIGDKVFYRARDSFSSPSNVELRYVDTSVLPLTEQTLEINPGTDSSNPNNLTAVGNYLFFSASDASGTELHYVDASQTTLSVQKFDIYPGSSNSNPQRFAVLGDRLFFVATDATNGQELRYIDTNQSTLSVQTININPGSSSSSPDYLTVAGGKLFFSADNGSTGRELMYISPGATLVNTIKINPDSSSSSPADFTPVGNKLYFSASVASIGREVAVINDVTKASLTIGDVNFINVRPDGDYVDPFDENTKSRDFAKKSSDPNQFTLVGNHLFFQGDVDFFFGNPSTAGGFETHAELYSIDTTQASPTAQLYRIQDGRGPLGSSPYYLTPVNDVLFFLANDRNRDTYLRYIDTSSPLQFQTLSTGPVDLVAGGDKVFLGFGFDSPLKYVDVDELGTVQTLGGFDLSFNIPSFVDGTLYFSGDDGTTGYELRYIDVIPGPLTNASVQSFDVVPGSPSSDPSQITRVGDRLFFSGGATFILDFAIPPSVDSVLITQGSGVQNSTLNTGDVVSASVTFSEAVTVTGTPQLALNIGGTVVQADFVSGSGTAELVFQYTIQDGEEDDNGISINANSLSLNGGTLFNATGNGATLDHGPVASNQDLRVDAVAPSIISIARVGDDSPTLESSVDFIVTFSEPIDSVSIDISDFSLASGLPSDAQIQQVSPVTDEPNKVAVKVDTGTVDGTINVNVLTGAVLDLAGNSNLADTTLPADDDTVSLATTQLDLDVDGNLLITDVRSSTEDTLTLTVDGGNLVIEDSNAALIGLASAGFVRDAITPDSKVSVPLTSITGSIQLVLLNSNAASNDVVTVTGNAGIAVTAGTDEVDSVIVTTTGTLTLDGDLLAALDTAVGSKVLATGDAQVGDGSGVGVAIAGELEVESGVTLTILDSGLSTLGSKTTVTGTLIAVNGVSLSAPSGVPDLLEGSGELRGFATVNGGEIDPTGSLEVTGNVNFASSSTLTIDIASQTSYDQILLGGSSNLNGSTLDLATIGTVSAGEIYRIIEKSGTSPVTGTFASLPEGTELTMANSGWTGPSARITYAGGDGNDVAIVIDGAPNYDAIIGANGNDETYRLELVDVGGGNLNLQLSKEGSVIDSRPYSSVSGASLTLNGGDGDDTFVLDLTNGDLIPSGGIAINGQANSSGGDSLQLLNGATTTVTHNFTDNSSGSIVLAGSVAGTITYTGLEPITDTVSATERVFNFNGADESITLSDDASNTGRSLIDSALGESVSFISPTGSMEINTQGTAGVDSIQIQGVDGSFAADLTINSGTEDSVSFNTATTNIGTGALDVITGSVTVGQSIAAASASFDVTNLSGSGDMTLTDSLSITNTGYSSTLSGAISDSAATLFKSGTGSLRLSGTNTYTGQTTIKAGELIIGDALGDGSITSDVDVQTDGSLTGSGTITGNVGGSGFFSPTGIMTIDGTFSPTGRVEFLVNRTFGAAGTDYDQFVVSGAVDLSGASVELTQTIGGAVTELPVMTLINSTSTATTTTDGSTRPAAGETITLGGSFYQLSYDAGSDNNDVVLTQVGGISYDEDAEELTVFGSNQSDAFRIQDLGSGVIEIRGSFGDVGTARMTFDAATEPVNTIVAVLYDGNDVADVRVDIPTIIVGGAGNDSLRMSSGVGILVGGPGTDSLRGNDRSVILIGGDEEDKMIGSSQPDILIGGSAANEASLSALESALDDLIAGNLANALLDLGTITDDLDIDDMIGRGGLDEILFGSGDRWIQ